MAGGSRSGGDQKQRPAGRIVVIGASAGGFEAIRRLVRGLPPDFAVPIFIVWHISPEVRSILPEILNLDNSIRAAHAIDEEVISPGRIYVAPPDRHLLVKDGIVRVTHGPKENRFRPAVDPLFRSAAYEYGNRVIGIILSGSLDDGTAGLWTVKHFGGTTVVQDPTDADVPSMPESALRDVAVDHCVRVDEMPPLLVRLAQATPANESSVHVDDDIKYEIDIAERGNVMKNEKLRFAALTPYTCPECHGVLSRIQNGNIVRFRCHTGHAFSANALLSALTEKVEESLYEAIRGIDESVILLNHLGDHLAEQNQPVLAAAYFKKAKEASQRAELVRSAALKHEQLTKDLIRKEADTDEPK